MLHIWSHWPSRHILKGLSLLLSLNFEPSTSTSSYIERQIFNTRVKFELVILINTLLYVVNFSLLLVDMFHQLQDTCGHKGLCCKTLKDVTRIIVVFISKIYLYDLKQAARDQFVCSKKVFNVLSKLFCQTFLLPFTFFYTCSQK